jgi:branched-chain amino acid transport system ATP-binding protein
MAQPLLQLERVVAGYAGLTVLHELSLEVDQRERLALIGRNGVGKTTTLRATMGLATVRSGRVLFDGRDITGMPAHRRAMLGLAHVPQTRDIFASLTVEENLVAGLKGRPKSAVDEAYALFPRLAERRKNNGLHLSGGEQQMLSVARALLGRPRLLLLDEPLEGLAPLLRQELLQAFRSLGDADLTVVIVEQQVDEALAYARRAVILDHGSVVHDAPADQLRADAPTLERLVGVAH